MTCCIGQTNAQGRYALSNGEVPTVRNVPLTDFLVPFGERTQKANMAITNLMDAPEDIFQKQ